MSSFAAIFPGQGAQLVGMGQDVAGAHAAARDVFAQADAVLGFKLSTLCFEGPAERLNATDIQQPAIFTTSVALHHAAVAAGKLRPNECRALAGLSLGEYTALHLAGVMSFEDALRLVYRRGQLMQAAAEASVGGMVALVGATEEQALALCEQVRAEGVVRPANYNCPGQIVISGDQAACAAALTAAAALSIAAKALPVAGAFHSELMRPAADGLREPLAACALQKPRLPVLSNVTADYHTEPDAIRKLLYEQVVSPVRWQACVERLIADGADNFVEIGPNRHLAGMLRKINRRMPVANVGTAADLTAAN